MKTAVELTESEYNGLAFSADRYNSSRVLYDALEPVEGKENTYTLQEHEAWEVREALEEEDSGTFPLLSNDLATKLHNFIDQFV